MNLRDRIVRLVAELDRINGGALPWQDNGQLPDFSTAENGLIRYFTRVANQALGETARVLHQNRAAELPTIDLGLYRSIVRQVAADAHASGDLYISEDAGLMNEVIRGFRDEIESRVARRVRECVHYFPATTIGVELDGPLRLGPVSILSRDEWISSVDFSESLKKRYPGGAQSDTNWRKLLAEALKSPREARPDGLAGLLLPAIEDCSAIVKVSIGPKEVDHSRKAAKLIAKTALDSISLCIGASDCFEQQVLHHERLPPIRTHTLIEVGGALQIPGWSLGNRVRWMSADKVKLVRASIEPILPTIGDVLEALTDESKNKYRLAARWATALDWFAEGCREADDAIAIAKVGASLDVLSGGGKYSGIVDMLTHLWGVAKDKQIVSLPVPLTLQQCVKRIYDDGRSKILHGDRIDRLSPTVIDRPVAVSVARWALIAALERIPNYSGRVDDKVFRTI